MEGPHGARMRTRIGAGGSGATQPDPTHHHPSKDRLVKIGKKLKKNNVAVDIVSFGCEVGGAEVGVRRLRVWGVVQLRSGGGWGCPTPPPFPPPTPIKV